MLPRVMNSISSLSRYDLAAVYYLDKTHRTEQPGKMHYTYQDEGKMQQWNGWVVLLYKIN